MFYGKLLYGFHSEMTKNQTMLNIFTKRPSYDDKISNEFKNLLNGMLQKEYQKRLTIDEVVNYLDTNKLKNTYSVEILKVNKKLVTDEEVYGFLTMHQIYVASFRYAILLEDNEKFEEAMTIYKYLAEKNYARAINNLGYKYEVGLGVEKDYKKSFYWYEKSANLGNSMSIHNLGIMYEYGKGIKKNEKYAKELYTLANKKGYRSN